MTFCYNHCRSILWIEKPKPGQRFQIGINSVCSSNSIPSDKYIQKIYIHFMQVLKLAGIIFVLLCEACWSNEILWNVFSQQTRSRIVLNLWTVRPSEQEKKLIIAELQQQVFN